MTAWQRTLVVVGLSQFFSMLAFSFAVPFVPFFFASSVSGNPSKFSSSRSITYSFFYQSEKSN